MYIISQLWKNFKSFLKGQGVQAKGIPVNCAKRLDLGDRSGPCLEVETMCVWGEERRNAVFTLTAAFPSLLLIFVQAVGRAVNSKTSGRYGLRLLAIKEFCSLKINTLRLQTCGFNQPHWEAPHAEWAGYGAHCVGTYHPAPWEGNQGWKCAYHHCHLCGCVPAPEQVCMCTPFSVSPQTLVRGHSWQREWGVPVKV